MNRHHLLKRILATLIVLPWVGFSVVSFVNVEDQPDVVAIRSLYAILGLGSVSALVMVWRSDWWI